MVIDTYGCIGDGFDKGARPIANFLSLKNGTSPLTEKQNLLTRLTCLVVKYVAVCVNRRLVQSLDSSVATAQILVSLESPFYSLNKVMHSFSNVNSNVAIAQILVSLESPFYSFNKVMHSFSSTFISNPQRRLTLVESKQQYDAREALQALTVDACCKEK